MANFFLLSGLQPLIFFCRERKLAERSEMEKRLEANVDKYQAFPEAQKLANLELERNLLQKVTKLGKMKASNLEQGVGHGQGAFGRNQSRFCTCRSYFKLQVSPTI